MKLCVSWKSGQASWDDYATLRYSYQIFPIKAGVTYQILFFRQKRYGHAAVVLDGDTIIIVGGESSRSTGEIVKRGFQNSMIMHYLIFHENICLSALG